MATIDHIIVNVNDLQASVAFYTQILGFRLAGTDGPFTLIQVSRDFQLLLCPHPTDGFEHYAFAMSRDEFDAVMERIKAAGVPHGPSFNTVGSNAGIGEERGARDGANALFQRSEQASAGNQNVRGLAPFRGHQSLWSAI